MVAAETYGDEGSFTKEADMTDRKRLQKLSRDIKSGPDQSENYEVVSRGQKNGDARNALNL